MRVQTQKPSSTGRSPAPTSPRTAQQQPSAPAGWKPATTSPTAQARALSTLLKSADGAKQAGKIIDAVVKKNDFARALNWEAAHIKAVKPYENGKFSVDVQLDVIQPNGKIQKHFFGAITDAKGKVIDVPQG